MIKIAMVVANYREIKHGYLLFLLVAITTKKPAPMIADPPNNSINPDGPLLGRFRANANFG